MTEAATSTSPQLKPPSPVPPGTLICPECKRYKHKEVKFANAKELGKHRRFIHKIEGVRAEIRRRYEAKKKRAATAAARSAEPPKKPDAPANPLMCPECEAKGEVTICKSPKSLGVHRRFKHGIPGKAILSNQLANARRAAARGDIYQPRPLPGNQLATLTPQQETNIASDRTQDNHHAPTIPTEAFAVCAGSILKEIRTFADTHGFVARDFTSGVVNYLRAASIR